MEGDARTWFTPKQRAELWERWRSGQCVADIARALARRNKSGVDRVLALHRGIAPAPEPGQAAQGASTAARLGGDVGRAKDLLIKTLLAVRVGSAAHRWKDFYGRDDDVLVVRGSTTQFNPTFDQAVVDKAIASDPARYSAVPANVEAAGSKRSDLNGPGSRCRP
jgi:hypothetical protein